MSVEEVCADFRFIFKPVDYTNSHIPLLTFTEI